MFATIFNATFLALIVVFSSYIITFYIQVLATFVSLCLYVCVLVCAYACLCVCWLLSLYVGLSGCLSVAVLWTVWRCFTIIPNICQNPPIYQKKGEHSRTFINRLCVPCRCTWRRRSPAFPWPAWTARRWSTWSRSAPDTTISLESMFTKDKKKKILLDIFLPLF